MCLYSGVRQRIKEFIHHISVRSIILLYNLTSASGKFSLAGQIQHPFSGHTNKVTIMLLIKVLALGTAVTITNVMAMPVNDDQNMLYDLVKRSVRCNKPNDCGKVIQFFDK